MVIVISILGSSLTRKTDGSRVLEDDRSWLDKYERLLHSKLPRGPVPPSAPSLCHNALHLYRQEEFLSTQDQSYWYVNNANVGSHSTNVVGLHLRLLPPCSTPDLGCE
ncbi:hypothetical protein E3N88_31521 [Mikania micrantha]|uniref:Uncharacterized protein n=1 Tax=Mikania micrantha TaxID=192012 RepID=A0A5N6MS11_9ASTR|nr:hypothetical protein E3N88_31521 [Mikania micrantha]